MVPRTSLVQSKHLARRVVEFVMVDLDVGERGVELHIDVALPRRKLERRHDGEGSCGAWAGFYLVEEEEEEEEEVAIAIAITGESYAERRMSTYEQP
jgi:hypothetical protein